MSPATYERAARAVEVIDKAKAEGKHEQADALRKVLNEESVKTAAVIASRPDPEREAILEKLAAGEAKTGFEAVRKVRAEQQIAAIEKAPKPHGKYHVLVVDPPWPCDYRAEDPTHRGAMPYHGMTVQEIYDLPIKELAYDDCILWLWTVDQYLSQALWAIQMVWDFEYKRVLTWIKPKMGNGELLRSRKEICLMAFKGKPVRNFPPPCDVLEAPAREHSRKPEKFYKLVEEYCPGSKCELFARERRKGWTSFGAELGLFDKEEKFAMDR